MRARRWRIERHDGLADVLRNGRPLQSDLSYERALQFVRRQITGTDRVIVIDDGNTTDITKFL